MDFGFCKFLPETKSTPTKKKDGPPKKAISFMMVTSDNLMKSRTERKKIEDKNKGVKEGISLICHRPPMQPENLSIFDIDSKIKEILRNNIDCVSELYKKLKGVLWISNNCEDSFQRIIANREVTKIRRKIQDLETTSELMFYIYRTSNIIEEYKKVMNSSEIKSFVKLERDDDSFSGKMKDITFKFFCIAQDYVDLGTISKTPRKLRCPHCNSLEFILCVDDDSIYVCKKCNTEIEILDDTPSFKDTDRVNMSSKYRYSTKGHFIEATKRFQGIQNADSEKIKRVVDIVKKEMDNHGLISERGTKKSVTKDQVYMFLSEKSLSDYYEDLNLIFHMITGEPCPDISKIIDLLYEDFDKLECVLEKIKDDDRTNSLSVNYKLYKLLQKRGFSCRKDDFYILKTKTKEDEHDEKMKEGWSILGWEWIPTF